MRRHEGLLILLACSLVFRSSAGAATRAGFLKGTSAFQQDDALSEEQQQPVPPLGTGAAEASNSPTRKPDTVDAATSTTIDAQGDTPGVENGKQEPEQGTESAKERATEQMQSVNNTFLSSKAYMELLNTAAHLDPLVFLGLLMVPVFAEQYLLMQRRARAQRLDRILGAAPKRDRNEGASGDSSQ